MPHALPGGSVAWMEEGVAPSPPPQRRRTALALAACALGLVATVALVGGGGSGSAEGRRVELNPRNQFETEPAFSADWSLRDLHHHVVRNFERRQTTVNKKLDAAFVRIDGRIEKLMHMIKHRPPGPHGIIGDRGAPGKAGPQGDKGEVGDKGAEGAEGQRGPSGRAGAPGIDGRTGPPGQDGPAGLRGPQGEPGVRGYDGPQGRAGRAGQPGPRGPMGPSGEEGERGPVAGVSVVHHISGLSAGGKKEASRKRLARKKHHESLSQRSLGGPGGPGGSSGGGGAGGGGVRVVKVDKGGGYQLTVEGPPGHDIEALLQGPDGFSDSFEGRGRALSGVLRRGGGVDYLEVTDRDTGRRDYFRVRPGE